MIINNKINQSQLGVIPSTSSGFMREVKKKKKRDDQTGMTYIEQLQFHILPHHSICCSTYSIVVEHKQYTRPYY